MKRYSKVNIVPEMKDIENEDVFAVLQIDCQHNDKNCLNFIACTRIRKKESDLKTSND